MQATPGWRTSPLLFGLFAFGCDEDAPTRSPTGSGTTDTADQTDTNPGILHGLGPQLPIIALPVVALGHVEGARVRGDQLAGLDMRQPIV